MGRDRRGKSRHSRQSMEGRWRESKAEGEEQLSAELYEQTKRSAEQGPRRGDDQWQVDTRTDSNKRNHMSTRERGQQEWDSQGNLGLVLCS